MEKMKKTGMRTEEQRENKNDNGSGNNHDNDKLDNVPNRNDNDIDNGIGAMHS